MVVKKDSRGISWIIRLWLPVLFFLGLIFYASSVPGKDIPRLFSLQAIVFHLFVYLFLAFFLIRALRRARPDVSASKMIFFVIIFGIIYGIMDELHQGLTPARSVSAFDVFIDGLGSVIGSIIYR